MGLNFVAGDREQAFLMPPDVRDWLEPGHLAWFVVEAVAGLDLAAFYARYRQDWWGRICGPITPRSRGFAPSTSGRWRGCSGRCWRCVSAPVWSALAWLRSIR